MNSLDELKTCVLETTRKHVDELVEMWICMFDESMCKAHLQRLQEHVSAFYEDLYKESLEKRKAIENDIRNLHEEANNLQCVLKPEIEEPVLTANRPLIVVQLEMEKIIVESRDALSKRHEHICELLLQQEALCEEIGESPLPLSLDPLSTDEEIDEFTKHLEFLRIERITRMNEVFMLRNQIKELLNILQLSPDGERLLSEHYPPLKNDTLVSLRQMYKNYEEQLKDLVQRINEMRNKLEKLWELLPEIDAKHVEYIRKHTKYNLSTHDILYIELQRCEAERLQHLETCTNKLRTELIIWWDKTLTSETERKSFLYYFKNDRYTEDLLLLHELQLDDLKRFYNNNQQIFVLFADRGLLWQRMLALEAKANDPGRYTNRGGQLLKEERERNTIAVKLKKIEQQITELVREYEQLEHMPFKVHGVDILELMATDWKHKRQNKEQLNNAHKRAPISLKNMSALTGSTTSLYTAPMTTKSDILVTTRRSLNLRKLINSNEKVTTNLNEHQLQTPSNLSGQGFLRLKKHNGNRSKSNIKDMKSPIKKLRIAANKMHRKSFSEKYSKCNSTKKNKTNNSEFMQSFNDAITPKHLEHQIDQDNLDDVKMKFRTSKLPLPCRRLLTPRTPKTSDDIITSNNICFGRGRDAFRRQRHSKSNPEKKR